MRTFLLLTAAAAAATAQPSALTVSQVVESALRNYPSIRVSAEQIQAAAAGIQLARTAYLPRVDALAQANYATRNNVFGLLFPQSVIPPISGPVLSSDRAGFIFGSALGALVTWEPFDFGQRRAAVAAAGSARAQSEAVLQRTRFETAATAADAYLTLAAAQETVHAAQAGVDRAEAIARTVTALANAQLRPGADQSRAEAEVAAARTQRIQADTAVDIARANLARFTGGDPARIAIAPQPLLRLPENPATPSLNPAANPYLVEQNAVIEQARAQLRVLERSYFPRFYAQGSVYSRGTGAEANGERLGGANGLAPNTPNAAIGFTVTFPVMDYAALHSREAAQSAAIRSQAARADQIAVELRAQFNRATAEYAGARRIAANTPIQVAAARAASEQAAARYQSGLGNIDEVAEAQRLLTQAEIDDALARLNTWRGLLAIATAAGDIQPFLAEVGK